MFIFCFMKLLSCESCSCFEKKGLKRTKLVWPKQSFLADVDANTDEDM